MSEIVSGENVFRGAIFAFSASLRFLSGAIGTAETQRTQRSRRGKPDYFKVNVLASRKF